jgi:hypothetical protein
MCATHNDTGEQSFPAAAHEFVGKCALSRWNDTPERAALSEARCRRRCMRLKTACIASNYLQIIRVFCSLI